MKRKISLIILTLFFQSYQVLAESAFDKQSALKAANEYANAKLIEHGEIHSDDIFEATDSWVAHIHFGYAGALSNTVLVVDKKTGRVSEKERTDFHEKVAIQ